MTITVTDKPATDKPAAVGRVDGLLTVHDYLVSRDRKEREPSMIEFALPWSLGVTVHIYPDTPILVGLYESDNRVTLRFGGCSAQVDVFLPADQIDRLINVLTAARRRLPHRS